MTHHTLAIGFGGKCLVLETPHAEVLAVMDHRLGRMAARPDWEVLGRLGVSRGPAGYGVNGERADLPLFDLIGRLECEVIDALVKAHSGLVWIHAGAVASEGRAVLISGHTGSGKSTLVQELGRRGWLFLTDDVAPIERDCFRVHPFLRTPMRRLNPAGVNLPAARVQELRRIPIDWDELTVATQPVPLGLLLFPVYDAKAELSMEPLPPAAAVTQLVQCCVGFFLNPGATLQFLSALATRIPAYRIRYSDGPAAAAAIAKMWPQTLAERNAQAGQSK